MLLNFKVVDWFGDLFGEGDYLDYEEDYTEVKNSCGEKNLEIQIIPRRRQRRSIIQTLEMNLCRKGRLGKGWKYSTEGEEGGRQIMLWKMK